MREGLIKGPSGTPAAELTAFGWISWGPVNAEQDVGPVLANHVHLPLESLVQKFWEVEEVPTKSLLTAEEKLCEDHYAATITRDDQLKSQVEDLNHLNAKMDLILESIEKGSRGFHNRNSRNDSSGNATHEALLFLTERVEEVERILTDAPEGIIDF